MKNNSYRYLFITLFVFFAIVVIVFTVKYFYNDKVKEARDDIVFEKTDEVEVYY